MASQPVPPNQSVVTRTNRGYGIPALLAKPAISPTRTGYARVPRHTASTIGTVAQGLGSQKISLPSPDPTLAPGS